MIFYIFDTKRGGENECKKIIFHDYCYRNIVVFTTVH